MAFRILSILFKSRIAWWSRSDNKFAHSYKTLVRGHSYRIVGRDHGLFFIGLKYLRIAAGLLLRNHDKCRVLERNEAALFDGSVDFFDARMAYFRGLVSPLPGISMGRDALEVRGFIYQKIAALSGLLLLTLLYLPHLLISRHKNNYALMLLEYAEWNCLLLQCRKYEVRKLYILSGYEKDTNFLSCLCQHKNVYTHRIPSSNPLYPYYESVVSDEFSFTAAFQPQQRKNLKYWYVDTITSLPPFNYKDLTRARHNQDDETKTTLAFISSGVWWRRERGDKAVGQGEYESEDTLMDTIKQALQLHPEWKLYIYLHPTEKKPREIYDRSVEYYSSFFGGFDFSIIGAETPSFDEFHKSNVAVSVYSSANIERLFMGMKCLYFPVDFEINPYEDTSLQNVVITKKNQLIPLVEESMGMTNEEFFKRFGLEDYRNFGVQNDVQ